MSTICRARGRGDWRPRGRNRAKLKPMPTPVQVDRLYRNLTTAHADPLICVIEDFLPHDDCTALIAAAEPWMRTSGTAFNGADQNVRTSSTCFLRRSRPEVGRLYARVGALCSKPDCHLEDPQVSRYEPGQYYRAHYDGPDTDEPDARMFLACGGQRLATLLVYLNDVRDGGETRFPLLGPLDVRPRRGRALLFLPGAVEGGIDRRLLHEALPAIDVKWVAQVWVRHGEDLYQAFMNTPESR